MNTKDTYDMIKQNILDIEKSLLTVKSPEIKKSLEGMRKVYVNLAIKELRTNG